MTSPLTLEYDVPKGDFVRAGEVSADVKKNLKQLGVSPEVIRRVSIAMYEGEINMVIHANGGTVKVMVTPDDITIIMKDTGPGIKDVSLAMTEGFSTATPEVHDLGFGAGMGLPNMRSNTDSIKVDSAVGIGTTITMKVNIPKG